LWAKQLNLKDTEMKPLPKVPSLPILAGRIALTNRNYRVVFEPEFIDWCKRNAKFMGDAQKEGSPECAWFERAKAIAREAR
jgi:hypothetical protein